jgi:hypothetical protein
VIITAYNEHRRLLSRQSLGQDSTQVYRFLGADDFIESKRFAHSR